jgi:hypothetical protein
MRPDELSIASLTLRDCKKEGIAMSAPANTRERRLASRFDIMTSADPQLVAAQPNPAIIPALDDPGI